MEDLNQIAKREEIKLKAVEYGQAKRIYENLDQVNDLVIKPIIESKGTQLAILCRQNEYTTDFVNAFNKVKRDARQIYVKHLEWFLENGVSLEEIKKYA